MEVKWIKIVTDIFDDEKILLIESMPEADGIIVIWFKLLCLAGKNNNSGVFMLNDKIAYTDEMLATIFRRPLNTVRLALKTFEQFGMVEIVDNVITIPNWSKHQSLDQLENKKEYMRNYMAEKRKKQKLLVEGKTNSKTNCKTNSKVNNKTNSKANVNHLDIDKSRLDIDKNRVDIYSTSDDDSSNKLQPIIQAWNNLNLNKLISINQGTNRYKLLQARLKDYGMDKVIQAINNIKLSKFLIGQNNNGWVITFDWLVKPNNFIKVLEGNYSDKEGKDEQLTEHSSEDRFANFKPKAPKTTDL